MSISISPYAVITLRNALDQHYPGGSEGYINTHGCEFSLSYNDRIVVQIGINSDTVKIICQELDEHGLDAAKEMENQLVFQDFCIVNLQTMKPVLSCPWLTIEDFHLGHIFG